MPVTRSKVTRAFERTNSLIPEDICEAMAWRDVSACQHAVTTLQDLWDIAPDGSCCKPYALLDPGQDRPFLPACEHLRALWAARDYLILARIGAPQDVWACHCEGSGVYTFRDGRVGKCHGCAGKGYQDKADRARNEHYWNHVAHVWRD